MQSDALDLASPIVLHADVRGDRRDRVPDESLLHSARRLKRARWCLHAGITAVSWQAHGGDPVLDAFWATCSGTDVAITGSLHGGSVLLVDCTPSGSCLSAAIPPGDTTIGKTGAP